MFCPWNVGRSLVQEVVLSMPGDESSGIDPFAFLTTVKDQLEAQMASAVSEVKDMSSTVDILSSDLRKSVANLFAGSTHHTKWLCVTDVRLQALQWAKYRNRPRAREVESKGRILYSLPPRNPIPNGMGSVAQFVRLVNRNL